LLSRTGSQALHLLMDVAIGVLGLTALAACILAWRLAQGPIDITALAQREQSLLAGPGAHVAIGNAQLAWEGFVSRDQPLDIRLRDTRITGANGVILAQVPQARVTLSIPQLLIGRLVPRFVEIDGASVQLERLANGALRLDLGTPASNVPPPAGTTAPADPGWIVDELARPARQGDNLPWLSQLHRVRVRGASVSIHDVQFGVLWQAPNAEADFLRLPNGGVSGQAKLDLVAGDVRATLTLHADLRADGTHLWGITTPVSPSVLARLAPQFAALAALDSPVSSSFDALVGPALLPRSARLTLHAGAGSLAAGNGKLGLGSADLVLSARPNELKLDSARIALAALPGRAKPPVLTATAAASLLAGKLHTTFAVAVDSLSFADLSSYWPDGVAGDSRGWMVQNLIGGVAQNAHVEGALDSRPDFSQMQLTALSGGLIGDDVSVVWLRPIPAITHGHAKLTIQGLDSIHIAIDSGEQGPLRITAGSSMDITKLQEKHQFGDIDVRLAGPLDAALKLLNHPRLKLLARSGLDFTGASGEQTGRLRLHLPLDDRVTIDDIAVNGTATITDAHLGEIAAGHDLDHAQIALKVDNDGLTLNGHGDFGTIPTELSVDMSFTDGPASQILQHVTAQGTATAAQMADFGLPGGVASSFATGTAEVHADYTARRAHSATLQLDADLARATMKTPFGWDKEAGAGAAAGVRLSFANGALVGMDHLHAEGPGLLIASHAKLEGERTHALVLDRLELGLTRAHGEIGFPAKPADPFTVSLSGAMLDVSSYFDEPQAQRAETLPTRDDDTPDKQRRGQAWRAELNFTQVQLAKGKLLAPLAVSAASDGLHLTRADIHAGASGDVVATIIPAGITRRLTVRSTDAGEFLLAMGVADNIGGGDLHLDGVFADSLPGDPLTGTATLENFTLRSAPAIGRLMQAMTLYGLTDALRGPGLHFSKLVAPYRWQRRVLSLKNARAFSPSLGLTAEGDIDLRRRVASIQGTVVPAYFFNQLLGDLPLIGKIFSPEKGGGVFAARYSVTGPLSNPKVGVNPLSALTPGFLREGFGLLAPATKPTGP
jgi:hypothetical protein